MSWSSVADRPVRRPRRDLARRGHSVLLLDRAGRIKPCGGAIPPRLIKRIRDPRFTAGGAGDLRRAWSRPPSREVDMPIEGGFVGMVDRDVFDEWLRERAAAAGAVRRTGTFERITRDADGVAVVHYVRARSGDEAAACARARSSVPTERIPRSHARRCRVPREVPYVFAYHEIVRSPGTAAKPTSTARAATSTTRVTCHPTSTRGSFRTETPRASACGSGAQGLLPAQCRGRAAWRHRAWTQAKRFAAKARRFRCGRWQRWDNGRDVVLAGDAAGVVAPASGEGIYYAMAGGRLRRGCGRAPSWRRETPAHCGPRASVSCRRTAGSSGCSASCSASGTRTTSGASDSSASAATRTCSTSRGRPTCTRSWCGRNRLRTCASSSRTSLTWSAWPLHDGYTRAAPAPALTATVAALATRSLRVGGALRHIRFWPDEMKMGFHRRVRLQCTPAVAMPPAAMHSGRERTSCRGRRFALSSLD